MNSRQGPSKRPGENLQPEATAEAAGSREASGGDDSRLHELRGLILGPEQSELQEIRRRLDDGPVRAGEIAAVLPASIQTAAQRDDGLADSAVPVVESALRKSVTRDPSTAAEILYPVFGPAIWNAVSTALQGMMTSLNQALERNFTLQGLRWRWEAARTGRSLAEVALRHSLVYRVEQIYLIHADSGILLQFAGAQEGTRDRELMSGMLTAIQDFVRDSFSVDSSQELRTLRVGEHEVWIERSPSAYLAAVILGSPSSARLRQQLRDALALIHRARGAELETFQGETQPFEICKPYLEACLDEELAPRKAAQPTATYVLAAIVLLIAIGWLYTAWDTRSRRHALLERLRAEPGITVVETGGREGRFLVSALRDPLALDPAALLGEVETSPDEVAFDLTPHLSLDPRMIIRRAAARLDPPQSVTLDADGEILKVSGSADREWIEKLRRNATQILGVGSLDDDALIDRDAAERARLREEIEGTVVLFDVASSTPSEAEQRRVDDVTEKLGALFASARRAAVVLRVEIAGSADASGTPRVNRRLSIRRAEWVRDRLSAAGVPAESLRAVRANSDASSARRTVSFQVRATDEPGTDRFE